MAFDYLIKDVETGRLSELPWSALKVSLLEGGRKVRLNGRHDIVLALKMKEGNVNQEMQELPLRPSH